MIGPARKTSAMQAYRSLGYARLLVMLLAFGALTISAEALEGDTDLFPSELEIGDTTLIRKGVGRMRRWFITGADVALYAPEGTARKDLLDGRPVILSLYYYTRISGDQFRRANRETLPKNVDADVLDKHADNIEKMQDWLTGVEEGDRYQLEHEPGRGTTLKRNGEKVGTIEDDDFASVFFQIWLGPDPVDQRMYDTLVADLSE